MADFRKGQLVAVRDSADSAWHLRVYDHASPEGLHFCTGLERATPPCWWNKICTAEVIWPDIFLASDRVTIEHLQEMRLRLHQRCEEYEEDMAVINAQVRWLCERLQAIGDRNGVQECPPTPHHDCRRGNCADCWAQASLEAVKEEPCQQ